MQPQKERKEYPLCNEWCSLEGSEESQRGILTATAMIDTDFAM